MCAGLGHSGHCPQRAQVPPGVARGPSEPVSLCISVGAGRVFLAVLSKTTWILLFLVTKVLNI